MLAGAFPRPLSAEAAAVVHIIPSASLAAAGHIGPIVAGDAELSIPYRIYNNEPAEELVAGLTAMQRLLVHAFYTRHHDGRVRERNLDQMVGVR